MKYISINWLHKELIEMVMRQEYPFEAMDVALHAFNHSIQKWREEHDI